MSTLHREFRDCDGGMIVVELSEEIGISNFDPLSWLYKCKGPV